MIVPPKYAMPFRRLVFWPFTILYGAILLLRHALYDRGFLQRTRPLVPTIAIGNLALGGTGKTPMLELVIRTLEDVSPLATLSRGYGRKGTGFREVQVSDTALLCGDEPLQVKRKFSHARVFVGVDRVKAIEQIQLLVPQLSAVLLDDALQHRRLDAGLNILLTTWQRPYCDDALIPAGRLRDLPARARAAHVVVVTKCPGLPTEEEQRRLVKRLDLLDNQQLYFSGIVYEAPCWMDQLHRSVPVGQDVSALVFTGIADPEPLLKHVRSLWGGIDHIAFPDHHSFSPSDLARLAARYANFAPGLKMLVTTEKDAARLGSVIAGSALEGLPIAVVGMKAIILNESERFAELIRRHVGTHPAHR